MRTVFINHKRYTVERAFNMVVNYEFTDKHGAIHLVDGEDVTEWLNSGDATPKAIKADNGIDTAIAYAKYYANEQEDGIFWWKVK